MNWFDILIGFFLLIAFVNGFRRGLIMQLLGLAGILLAVIFGGKLAEIISPRLDNLSNFTPETLHVLSYIIAFAGIFLVAIVVGRIVEKIVDFAFLGFFNRLLGGIVAIATTMVVLSLALNLLLLLDTRGQIINERTKNESFFFERVESVVPAIVPFLNREFWEKYIPEKYRREEINSEQDSLHYRIIYIIAKSNCLVLKFPDTFCSKKSDKHVKENLSVQFLL